VARSKSGNIFEQFRSSTLEIPLALREHKRVYLRAVHNNTLLQTYSETRRINSTPTKMHSFRILVAVLMAASCVRAASFYNEYADDQGNTKNADYYYDDEVADTDSSCKCQNGGICVLDNDFCVCGPGFTGRHCEINLRSPKAKLSCGHLLNGESEFIKCAKCTCNDQFLTCIAMATLTCDRFSSSDVSKLKGLDLKYLISLMVDIENDAYASYVNEFTNQKGYKILVRDVQDIKDMSGLNAVNSADQITNRLVIFKENQRVINLYFPLSNTVYSSGVTSPQLSVSNGLFSLFICILMNLLR
jgi:hypothetical protein